MAIKYFRVSNLRRLDDGPRSSWLMPIHRKSLENSRRARAPELDNAITKTVDLFTIHYRDVMIVTIIIPSRKKSTTEAIRKTAILHYNTASYRKFTHFPYKIVEARVQAVIITTNVECNSAIRCL